MSKFLESKIISNAWFIRKLKKQFLFIQINKSDSDNLSFDALLSFGKHI